MGPRGDRRGSMGSGHAGRTAVLGRVLAALAVVAILAAVIAGCGGGGSTTTSSSTESTTAPSRTKPVAGQSEGGSESATWSDANNGLGNQRTIPSEISSKNVAELKPAWELTFPPVPTTNSLVPAGQFSDFASTPVVGPEGIVYLQDIGYNVYAVD